MMYGAFLSPGVFALPTTLTWKEILKKKALRKEEKILGRPHREKKRKVSERKKQRNRKRGRKRKDKNSTYDYLQWVRKLQ